MSFWSVGSSTSRGVGILLSPEAASSASEWNHDKWSSRVIGVRVHNIFLLNVYALNLRAEREDFFKGLDAWNWPAGQTVLLGDFNCVQSPQLDRMGPRTASRPESPALCSLLESSSLGDARLLREHAEDDDFNTSHHYTYWTTGTASRIDRFYVPHSWAPDVLWVSTAPPPQSSDHDQVVLHLRKTSYGRRLQQRRSIYYPIRSNRPDQVLTEIIQEMTDKGVGHAPTIQSWDSHIAQSIHCVSVVRKREKQRRKRFVAKLRKRNRRQFTTRTQWISANVEEMREGQLARLGEATERSSKRLRWSYQRIANWERDQRVTSLRARHGSQFSAKLSVADQFASEWAQVLSRSHRTVANSLLAAELQTFTTIPMEQRLTSDDNERFLRPYTEADVLAAITGLSRHKSAGPDGLNNDFYKDTAALMVPALVGISNHILAGSEVPSSFLESRIIPLRKKGDSDDAMDYRPISLLQTSYKVFAKVLATRLQHSLPRAICDSQQGFVHGRKMSKSVMMMLAQLTTATCQDDVTADQNRCIMLLDFKKAYDTVDRDFMYEALRMFGFDDRFVDLIRRVHTGTSARFDVNGYLSHALQVRSGIRRGCPLAPLLFLLVVEVLSQALQQDTLLKGLEVPGLPGQTHLFSACVDDSTLFLANAGQISHALRIVTAFGALSGLHVQPDKSKIIFLNRAKTDKRYEGIAVVSQDDTTRYLGYEIGTGELENKNWALRIQKIQRRLLTATRVATSVENRVLILNTIVLPALLFTASVFDIPIWAEKELNNLYKQFLWAHATSTDARRHKVNPGLLVTPRHAGGIGLIDVTVAVKTQRTKHALIWLTQRSDKYYAAWRIWAFRGINRAHTWQVTPAMAPRQAETCRRRTPGLELQRTLGTWQDPTPDQLHQLKQWVATHFVGLLEGTVSWYDGDDFVIAYSLQFPHRPMGTDDMPAAIRSFWATFNWAENPWICDQRGNMLSKTTYNHIQACPLEHLGLERTGPAEFVLKIPQSTIPSRPHSAAKLRRWATAVLLASPTIAVGQSIRKQSAPQLRHAPPALSTYMWTLTQEGVIAGRTPTDAKDPTRTITLNQGDDGVHWRCIGPIPQLDVGSKVGQRALIHELRQRGLVFAAHTQLHRFPWEVPDKTPNRVIRAALTRQVFRSHKKVLAHPLGTFLDRLEERAGRDTWQRAALCQTPKQVWDDGQGLTAYQVWTGYRIASRQLHLHHAGRLVDNTCGKQRGCLGEEETLAHLFWDCPYAVAFWTKLVEQWTGVRASRQTLDCVFSSCASRRIASVPAHRKTLLDERFQEVSQRQNECGSEYGIF